MGRLNCAVAWDTRLESPDGPLSVKAYVGKAIPVFTRDPSGRIRFRMVVNARKVADAQPVLRIDLENGQSFRVGADQIVYDKDMSERRAGDLRVDDELMPAFHYLEGYEYRDDPSGERVRSRGTLRVTAIEPDGTADLYSLGVRRSDSFVVSAGVLCKAEPVDAGSQPD